jgi:hypothetical protein
MHSAHFIAARSLPLTKAQPWAASTAFFDFLAFPTKKFARPLPHIFMVLSMGFMPFDSLVEVVEKPYLLKISIS